jgi:hypothetical protein
MSLSDIDREELFEIYTCIQEQYCNLVNFINTHRSSFHGVDAAKAYWLASLDVGINAENHFTYNPTLKTFLEDNGIIDEDGEFIEDEEEDYDE